jgi:hypothetical protein
LWMEMGHAWSLNEINHYKATCKSLKRSQSPLK